MNPIKIGFVLLSNSQNPIASTRIAALSMFRYLREADFEPSIVYEPLRGTETPDVSSLAPRLKAEGFKIIFFQKVYGPSVEALARELSAVGIRTVYSVCDLVNVSMTAATDQTITVTEYLKSLYPRDLHHKIAVVHDGIEHPEVCKMAHRSDRGSRTHPMRAILVTSDPLHELPVIGAPPPWLQVTIVGRYAPPGQAWRRMREATWRLKMRRRSGEGLTYLRFLANPRIQCIAWDADGVYDALRQADIGIIPIDTSPGPEPGEPSPRWRVKSENRLTLKMCVGLPVIATPIPAYEPVIEHGKNGFFARSRQDWFEYLEALRDPDTRRSLGELARASVVTRYSTEEQARRLIAVLKTLTPNP